MKRLVRLLMWMVIWVGLHCQIQAVAEETAIDRYVHAADDAFRWKIVSSVDNEGYRTVIVDLVSQSWLSEDEVDRTEWQHWVKVVVPDELQSDIAFVMVTGGSNGGNPPTTADGELIELARLTGTAVAELKMVPNQPLVFHGDGEPRKEDNLIGYTWDQFFKTGRPEWLARAPMTKSVVRCMDMLTELLDREAQFELNRFVVAGASKRGWTTWMTAAVDERVVAIVPIVIDVLNSRESMKHHFAAYGFWAPAIGDYVRHRIMPRMEAERFDELARLVDPFSYRERLTMPKLILNAAGDQFFLPDSSQFYWQQLPGPKYLRYVANADHGLDDSDAFQTLAAFYSVVVREVELPELAWEFSDPNTLAVEPSTRPAKVVHWQATNPLARDFRLESLGPAYRSRELQPDSDGVYRVRVGAPERGWSAHFVEATFDVGGPFPLKLTSQVRVAPERLPFVAKDPSQEASLTVTAEAGSAQEATKVVAELTRLEAAGELAARDFSALSAGKRVYVNLRPPLAEFEAAAMEWRRRLAGQGCAQIAYQLESGLGATLAPGLDAAAGQAATAVSGGGASSAGN